jgi:hypothetical protein
MIAPAVTSQVVDTKVVRQDQHNSEVQGNL